MKQFEGLEVVKSNVIEIKVEEKVLLENIQELSTAVCEEWDQEEPLKEAA